MDKTSVDVLVAVLTDAIAYKFYVFTAAVPVDALALTLCACVIDNGCIVEEYVTYNVAAVPGGNAGEAELIP